MLVVRLWLQFEMLDIALHNMTIVPSSIPQEDLQQVVVVPRDYLVLVVEQLLVLLQAKNPPLLVVL
jgi:hypothetical protein